MSESRKHAEMLKATSGTFEKIMKDEEERARLLGELVKKTAKK